MRLLDRFFRKSLSSVEEQKNGIKIKEQDNHVFSMAGYNVSDESLLFHRKLWAGKAEYGIDWIFLKIIDKNCQVTHISFHSNVYGNSPVESASTDEAIVSCTEMADWNVKDMISFINESLHFSILKDDCIDDNAYINWTHTITMPVSIQHELDI